MAVRNPYAAYNNSKILTASPAELTLMLYDGAIKFCNIAVAGLKENNIDKAYHNISKAEKIIPEFRNTLDFSFPVAKDFDVVYRYLLERLAAANYKRSPEIIEEVLEHLRTMRDTWKEVMGASNTANSTQVS